MEGPGSGTVSGTFVFDEIQEMLDACAARGKFFMPLLMHRKFSTTSHSTPFGSTADVLPSDLVGTYQFPTGGGSPSGFSGALYEETVRVRLQQAIQAIYDQFGSHPNFVGVQTEETAGMNQGPNYTLSKHKTQLRAFWSNCADYAATYGRYFSPGFNFLEGAWTGNLSILEGHWADVLNGLRTDNVVFYSPDMLLEGSTNYNGNNNQVYPLQDPSYSGHVSAFNAYTIMGSMQNHSLQTAHNGDNDVDRTFTTLRPLYEGVIWTAVNFWDYTFDNPRDGFTYGDIEGVARLAYDHSYNSNYAGAIGSDPYDLYATDTVGRGVIPFPVNWPAEPNQSMTVSASTFSALQSAVNAGARRITYTGVSSSGLAIGSDDVWVEMAEGSSIGNVSIMDGTHRVRISAIAPRTASVGHISVGSFSTDVLFRGLNVGAATGNAAINIWDTRRIAFVGCDVQLQNNYFALWAGSGVGSHASQDVIIANTRVRGNGQFGSMRLQHITRLIIVDSRADTRNTGYASLRLEYNTNSAWVRNFEGMGGGFTLDPQVGSSHPTATVHDITYYDTNVYHTGQITITDTQGDLSNPSKVYNITMDDVLFHSDNHTPGTTIGGVQGSWNVGIARYADFAGFPEWAFR